MGAGQNGTGAQSSFGFRGRVSESGTRKERPLEGGSRSRGAREAGDLLEKCLLAPHCRERHRAMACEKLKGLSLPHRQSIIAEQELCANCLRHSDLDVRKRRDCLRRAAEPHWVGSAVRRPGRTPSPVEEIPTMTVRWRAGPSMPAGWMSWSRQRQICGRKSTGQIYPCCSARRGK